MRWIEDGDVVTTPLLVDEVRADWRRLRAGETLSAITAEHLLGAWDSGRSGLRRTETLAA